MDPNSLWRYFLTNFIGFAVFLTIPNSFINIRFAFNFFFRLLIFILLSTKPSTSLKQLRTTILARINSKRTLEFILFFLYQSRLVSVHYYMLNVSLLAASESLGISRARFIPYPPFLLVLLFHN